MRYASVNKSEVHIFKYKYFYRNQVLLLPANEKVSKTISKRENSEKKIDGNQQQLGTMEYSSKHNNEKKDTIGPLVWRRI